MVALALLERGFLPLLSSRIILTFILDLLLVTQNTPSAVGVLSCLQKPA